MSIWNSIAITIASIFLGVLAFVFGPIFLLLFVPIVVAIGWDYTGRVDRLEKRLYQLETRLAASQAGATHEHSSASTSS